MKRVWLAFLMTWVLIEGQGSAETLRYFDEAKPGINEAITLSVDWGAANKPWNHVASQNSFTKEPNQNNYASGGASLVLDGVQGYSVFVFCNTSRRPYQLKSCVKELARSEGTVMPRVLGEFPKSAKDMHGRDVAGGTLGSGSNAAGTRTLYTQSRGDMATVEVVYGLGNTHAEGAASNSVWKWFPRLQPEGQHSSSITYTIATIA